jgi:hypothetical protein
MNNEIIFNIRQHGKHKKKIGCPVFLPADRQVVNNRYHLFYSLDSGSVSTYPVMPVLFFLQRTVIELHFFYILS